MRKLYSLVLMATALLIGTNAWAELSTTYDQDEHVASVQINNGTVQYASTLKEAFDAVDYGQTATIILLESGHNIEAPIDIPHEIVKEKIKEGGMAGPNITLDLNGKSLTANNRITPFRIMKGSLTITGQGTISKAPFMADKWRGEALISICGAESPSMANWSTLTIDKDVTLSIVSDDANNPSHGIAIAVQDFDGLNRLKKTQDDVTNGYWDVADDDNYSDPLGITNTGYTNGKKDDNQQLIKGASEKLRDKYGYCTYYYPSRAVISNKEMDYSVIGPGSANVDVLPMECGQPATATAVQQGSAFGVKIFVKGKIYAGERGIQVIGHVNQKPICTENKSKRWKDEAPYYQGQYPYIKVCNSAYIEANEAGGSNGIYVAGYAVCDIEGEVTGATGIYMKAGDVELHDAIVTSNSNTFNAEKGASSGVGKAGGSAIVVESTDAYAGDMGVTLSGDTKVKGDGGYGILEVTSKQDGNATTTHITITGATIESGQKGGIAITDDTKNVTGITGVTTDSPTVTVTNGNTQTTVNVSTLVPNNGDYHSTTTVVDGKTVTVITQGAAPETQEGDDPTPWSWCADNAQSGKSVAWTKIEADEIEANATVVLNELQIISGTENNLQQLTIKDGAALEVNQLTMNDYARIIVEAGGKLIVKGTQGIVAGKVENILLKNEENKPAVFLFNPAVTSNRHPEATVEFTSKAFRNSATEYGWQKFGVPTQTGELKEIIIENNVATAFGKFNYAAATPAWEIIGYINHTTNPDLELENLDQAFEYYQMLHNTATVGTKVTFKGNLVGNDCPAPVVRAHYWNGYANSYSAPIDGSALLAQIPAPADKAFYLYEYDVVSEKFSWVAKSNLSIREIQPMQPFLIRNPKDDEVALALNYAAAVYNPATTPSNAPARSVANNMTKVEFIVRGEAGVDHVIVAQDDEFSAAFDNGYDVTKYMNDDVNMYVTADEKMAIFATDNLENTYVGLSTVKGGNYTITFANVQGREFTLIDHETGARVLMVEGNTYEFTAAANATNDYRFEIVESAKMPTAIENAEAVKSAKGIYTITGQFMGEMSVWNSLPAGVYVVNGEKRVK